MMDQTLDPFEEYFRKKKKGNDEDTYFPLEDSEPPHYQDINKFKILNIKDVEKFKTI